MEEYLRLRMEKYPRTTTEEYLGLPTEENLRFPTETYTRYEITDGIIPDDYRRKTEIVDGVWNT